MKVWLPSEAASAGGSGLSDGIRHTTWLRERGITSAALLPASTTSAASIGALHHEGREKRKEAKKEGDVYPHLI